MRQHRLRVEPDPALVERDSCLVLLVGVCAVLVALLVYALAVSWRPL